MPIDRRSLLQSGAAALALQVVPGSAAASEPTVDGELALVLNQLLNDYPEAATGAGVDRDGRAPLRSRLADRSAAGQAAIKQRVADTLARLRRVETARLDPVNRTHLDVARDAYEQAAEGFAFPYGDMAVLNVCWSYRSSPYVVAQNVGAFVEIPSFLAANHALNAAEDADAYLVRMEAYATQLDGESERALADAERGVVLPDFLMDKHLQQLRTARAAPMDQWGIVHSLASRSGDLPGNYGANAVRVASERIAPALDRQIAMLESLRPRATSEAGAWTLPQGDAYYAWALRAGTTTTMTPDEVHQMGLDELRDLQGRMDPILRSLGFTDGSVSARMAALSADPRYQFAEGDAGRAEIIAFLNERIVDVRTRMPQAFETLTPARLEVTRIPPDIEAGAPRAYGGPGSVDGREPGRFFINLRNPALHNRVGLADIAYHEAIPGHVWQGEYTFQQPLVRTMLNFNAYREGWGMYAQQLADELGVYDEFPAARLGYLNSLAFRACRLVVDTGLHAKRWTRAQTVDWLVEASGANRDQVQSEVDRYCAWPGQACGYKVGHSAIVRLRDAARAQLGELFDVRGFNDAVVKGGNVPMTVLGRVVDDYVARARARVWTASLRGRADS